MHFPFHTHYHWTHAYSGTLCVIWIQQWRAKLSLSFTLSANTTSSHSRSTLFGFYRDVYINTERVHIRKCMCWNLSRCNNEYERKEYRTITRLISRWRYPITRTNSFMAEPKNESSRRTLARVKWSMNIYSFTIINELTINSGTHCAIFSVPNHKILSIYCCVWNTNEILMFFYMKFFLIQIIYSNIFCNSRRCAKWSRYTSCLFLHFFFLSFFLFFSSSSYHCDSLEWSWETIAFIYWIAH